VDRAVLRWLLNVVHKHVVLDGDDLRTWEQLRIDTRFSTIVAALERDDQPGGGGSDGRHHPGRRASGDAPE
jgi:hypothetical protein